MKITLNDTEIRIALAQAIEKKLDHAVTEINHEECWFEARAGQIEGDEISDIHEVEFIYDTGQQS
jgi:hypothetical protein